MPPLRSFILHPSSFILLFSLAGCVHHAQLPPGGRATDLPDAQASPEFWLDKPAVVHVPARDFDRLWAAAQAAVRHYNFVVDRRDYREGVLTTYPNLSPEAFEFWRPDNSTLYDVAAATLDTYRRTIRFEIERRDDGTFDLTPKVLVERKDVVNRRITSVVRFRETLTPTPNTGNLTNEVQEIGGAFWYPVSRDYDLERRLARSVVDHLR